MTTNESAPDPTAGAHLDAIARGDWEEAARLGEVMLDRPATPDADDTSEPLVPIEECIDADALIEAMIHAGAWAVLEASMDIADRYPGQALVKQTVADVRTWLADREAAAATKARADEREQADATWALRTPSVWESPDERSIPALLAGIGQMLEHIARGGDV